ncbi:DUF4403 family protein [Autumnicola musiva]|uniref:DUF4403 family protein n=1 Tax=Autumnicola musiva TaxID=3075589 RepID=A0ABU3D217_9FLAO|nr:DUF4403 family protein [Zunongwangia sp. F117]MDT0675585.1 DUF4403 family protein [Zunongwangia sp. F117]
MKEAENIVPGNIIIQLPLKVQYDVLEDILRERAIGEKIGTINENGETTNYAEILDISFGESLKEEFNFAVNLKFRTLTTLFKNKVGRLEMDLALEFLEETQEIGIRNYHLEGDTENWLMNNFIEKMVNNVLYGKLKKKMKFDLRPLVKEQLEKINKKISSGVEPRKGIFINGALEDFRIESVFPGSGFLLVRVDLKAEALVSIDELDLKEFSS